MMGRILAVVLAVGVFGVVNAADKVEPAAAQAPAAATDTKPKDVAQQRVEQEVAKLEEMEREWQKQRGAKLAKDAEEKKKDEKKGEKAEKSAKKSNDSRGGAAYNSHNSSNGGWVEIGGVSSSSNSSSSSTGSYASQSSYSSSSIGVRTTIVRLDGPTDN